MIEEHDEERLSDEDIKAAVRHWLSSITWTKRIDAGLNELSPGTLRSLQDRLPDILLDAGKDETVSSEHTLIEEAWSALEYSDYSGWGKGETLTRTVTVMQPTLKEYVDKRMQEVFEPDTQVAVSSRDSLPHSAPANMSKISTFIQKWQNDIKVGFRGGKGLQPETTDQYHQTVELFIGLMGDLPVGKISYDLAADFREKLLGLPATHGKGRTGSIKAELALAKANKDGPRLSMKTAKRHFSGMNSIWKWLIFCKHVPPTSKPFSGHSFPGTKSRKSARDAWSSEDLERFFTSSEYKEASFDSAMHWLPLISLYSGLRLEEICRLRPDKDLVTRDKVYCFDIKKREGWDPKSEAGTRLVPVHSWLLSHGFEEFVRSQSAAHAEHLFPELRLSKKKLSSGFSRDFSRVKQEIGVGDKTAFHSFRHTFRTVLESTDHKESHINAIMGHEGGSGEGRVYTKGVTTAKLKEVVESFDIGSDFCFSKNSNIPSPNRKKPKIAKVKLTPPVLDANGKIVRGKMSKMHSSTTR